MDKSIADSKKEHFTAAISTWSFGKCLEFLKMPNSTMGRKIPKDLTTTEAQALVLARMNSLHAVALNEQVNQIVLMNVLGGYRWLLDRAYGQQLVHQMPYVRFGNGFELNQDLMNLRDQLIRMIVQQQQQQLPNQHQQKLEQRQPSPPQNQIDHININNNNNRQEESEEPQPEEWREVPQAPKVVGSVNDRKVHIPESVKNFKEQAKKMQQQKQEERKKKREERKPEEKKHEENKHEENKHEEEDDQ